MLVSEICTGVSGIEVVYRGVGTSGESATQAEVEVLAEVLACSGVSVNCDVYQLLH